MIEYRFICIHKAETRRVLRYAALSNNDLARMHAEHMLCEFSSVFIYQEECLVAHVCRSIGAMALR
jgi:hypothetical protein